MNINNTTGCYNISVQPVSFVAGFEEIVQSNKGANRCINLVNNPLKITAPAYSGATYTWYAYNYYNDFNNVINLSSSLGNSRTISITDLSATLKGYRNIYCVITIPGCATRRMFYQVTDNFSNPHFYLEPDNYADLCATHYIDGNNNNQAIDFGGSTGTLERRITTAYLEFVAHDIPSKSSTFYTWSSSPTNTATITESNKNEAGLNTDYHPAGKISSKDHVTGDSFTITISTTGSSCNESYSYNVNVKGTQPSLGIFNSMLGNISSGVSMIKGCSFYASVQPLHDYYPPFNSATYSWSPFSGIVSGEPFSPEVTLSPEVSTSYDVYVNHDYSVNPTGCCTRRSFNVDVYDFFLGAVTTAGGYSYTNYLVDAFFKDEASSPRCPGGDNDNCKPYHWFKCNIADFDPANPKSSQSLWSSIGISSSSNEIEISTNYSWYLICQVDVANDINKNLFGCTAVTAYTLISHTPEAKTNRFIEATLYLRKEDTTKNISDALLVYPNPGTGKFNLSIQASKNTDEDASVIVYDLTGKEIFNRRINLVTQSATIELPLEMPEGIYLLSIRTVTDNYFAKLIVQKP